MRNKAFFRGSVAFTMGCIMSAVGVSGTSHAQADDDESIEEIVVTGIRRSLTLSRDIKKDARGVVDAISAEDMGKFPDTNLAESLQRITGVSIERENGEGSKVTVRGFGADYNLVTLNGRQMPTSGLEDTFANNSRSFDFANLAAEGVAGVQVFKTSRASMPTGGLGSLINISTTRPLDNPGTSFSIGAKGVIDESVNEGTGNFITPELSGVYSSTFNDDRMGIAISASYQERDSSYNQAAVGNGWRSHKGAANDWGTLPQVSTQTTNRPGPSDTYSVPQNLGYSYNNISRERFNGQLTLQYEPVSNVKATLDYTYSEHRVATTRNDLSVWFNFGDITSSWTDGPLAAPLIYSEDFGTSPSDLSMGGGKFATLNTNKSIGFNLEWEATDRLVFDFDYHNSSAESKADSPYGSNNVIGTADFSIQTQTVDFTKPFPVLSIAFANGANGIDASRHVSTGTSFRNGLMRTEIEQAQMNGTYDLDMGMVKSLDFGVAYTENKVRSAFSNAQRDTWGGAGPASDLPDSLFTAVNLPGFFERIPGSDDPNLIQQGFIFNFDEMVKVIDSAYNACGGTLQCVSNNFNTDRRTTETSYSAYAQLNAEWEMSGRPANLVAGVRYEETDVASSALVPIPTGTQWVAANEFGLIFSGQQDFTQLTGSYKNWLPQVDFDVELRDDIILRASYGESIARPNYQDIQGGQVVDGGFRINGGTGSQGDPGLLPFASKNIDLSAEWYYDDFSYFSVGFFNKKVKNFIGTSSIQASPFNLPHPAQGPRFNAAVAALGGATDLVAIRNWIFANTDPAGVQITGTDANGDTTGNILGVAGDPNIVFNITVPVNAESANLNGFEFAFQHMFGDSGFGVVANYTIVNGDIAFDDTVANSDYVAPQFALLGLSDSANVIGFYDKDGVQARIAWNWRDKFLTATATGSGINNPMYTQAYGQFDANVSYDLTDGMTVFAEVINLTNNYQRLHGRTVNNVLFVTETGRRVNIGARYRF